MRARIQRIVEVLDGKGEFGSCTCGGIIKFYSDAGVKCSSCNKLYGVWTGGHKAASWK
ncbi:MAG: hypothetical protein V3U49_02170 [Nitrososphaerales archaeon]